MWCRSLEFSGMKTLIFIHARRFLDKNSGLASRTALMLSVLERQTEYSERILVSPAESPENEALLKERGWKRLHPSRYLDWKNSMRGRISLFMWRGFNFLGARWLQSCRTRLVTICGGADLCIGGNVAALLRAKAGATIWLARCDLTPILVNARSDQSVFLDANDSVANLTRCYDSIIRGRQIAGLLPAEVVRTYRKGGVPASVGVLWGPRDIVGGLRVLR